MTRHLRSLPAHALTALRSALFRDLVALAAVVLFILVFIFWSAYAADQISLRRYS